MMTRMRPPTDRDMETLGDLISGCDSHDKIFNMTGAGLAPLDFGGGNGSHHGATATKLVRYGYVEHKKRGYEWGQAPRRGYRGSKLYRPTGAGRLAFAGWAASRKPKDFIPALRWACQWLDLLNGPAFPTMHEAAAMLREGPRGRDLDGWRSEVRKIAVKLVEGTRHLGHPSLDALRAALA